MVVERVCRAIIECFCHIPLGKEALYGSLDPTTLEWTDGIFTKVLREVGVLFSVLVLGVLEYTDC